MRHILANILLVLVSVFVTLAGLELVLRAHNAMSGVPPAVVPASPPPAPSLEASEVILVPPELRARAEARHALLTMPDAWKLTEITVPGGNKTYYWQGALHVQDSNGMRRATPLPDKSSDYRVMVVGDSLTFGYGISEGDTFVGRLNDWMAREYRVEFLNLGVSGAQSEDILGIVKRHIGALKPDLVIYSICLNDFLPSGVGQYMYVYAFPLPDSVKAFFSNHSRLGAFLSEAYDVGLRRLHLRRDFYDDILTDFQGYQVRFRRDVAEMNRVVKAAGLPPVIAIVVDQFPHRGGPGYQISRVAESAAVEAGMELISSEPFYRQFNGSSFHVSRWEGHPNEVANFIWATMIQQRLRLREDIQRFKR